MKPLAILTAFVLLATLPPTVRAAEFIPQDVLADMRAADVVILGEIHDNPQHHLVQAEAVEAITPTAVVWEMVTENV